MALKKITFGFAERHLINQLLNDISKVSVESARMMRGINDTLELRDVRNYVDELTKIYEKIQPPKFLRWLDLLDIGLPSDKAAKKEHKPRTFTMDDVYITWLSEQLKNHDWNKQVIQNPQTGQRSEVEVPIPLEQSIVIANTADALLAAEAVQ